MLLQGNSALKVLIKMPKIVSRKKHLDNIYKVESLGYAQFFELFLLKKQNI